MRAAKTEQPAELWQEHFSEDGRPYFYCVRGDYSQWQPPAGPVQLQVQCQADDGRLYWLNTATDEVSPIELLIDS